jgi:DNA (cytosine-5)-methyltransferase 1
MDELGYDAEWNLFNSKDWGVPQSRERVYTVGHLRIYGPKEIFPLKGADGKNSVPIKPIAHSNNFRRYNETYDPSGIVECLDTGSGGGHNPYVPVEYP